MRHRFSAAVVGITLLAPTSSTYAQQHGSSCSASSTALPPELASWSTRQPVTATGEAQELGGAKLVIGSAADATLISTSDVRYVVRPEKPGGTKSYGGMFSFTVDRAGTYRVALGSGAWIDVLKGKTAVVSAAHGHGPDCSGVRKMVDFSLTPGGYTLQIAASEGSSLTLMVARLR